MVGRLKYVSKAIREAKALHATDGETGRDRDAAGKACQDLALALKSVADQDVPMVAQFLSPRDCSYFNGWVGAVEGQRGRRLWRAG